MFSYEEYGNTSHKKERGKEQGAATVAFEIAGFHGYSSNLLPPGQARAAWDLQSAQFSQVRLPHIFPHPELGQYLGAELVVAGHEVGLFQDRRQALVELG